MIVSEVCNAAWKRRRRGEATERQAERIAVCIATAGVTLIPDQTLARQTLARQAMAIARCLDHPVYDCFYLALAEERAARVVTADRRLIARVGGTAWDGRVQALADFSAATP